MIDKKYDMGGLALQAVRAAGFASLAVGALALAPVGAFAQEDGQGGGHGGTQGGTQGGGHEEEGEEGHEEGGKGKGPGNQPPAPGVFPGTAAAAADDQNAQNAMIRRARVSDTYYRLELGAAHTKARDANWLPGGGGDPRVFFDLDADTAGFASVAVGRNLRSGWRAEAALSLFGASDFSGDWSFTDPVTPGPHASMRGSVKSIALMANGIYDFDIGGPAIPFVTAGIGFANNSMDDWTRINPALDTRSFEGNSETDVAWSVGAGVAFDVDLGVGAGPAKLELAWRYFDLGSASGSVTRVDGIAGGTPIEPLNFDVTHQVVSIGLRIAF